MHHTVQRPLDTLNISTFSVGDVLHYCEECPWQSEESYAMKPKCPECGAHLYIVFLTEEAIKEINEYGKRK